MYKLKFAVSILLIILLAHETNQAPSQQTSSSQATILQKTMAFIQKQGFKILVNEAVLKAEIKIVLRKFFTKATAKAAAKKIPVLGAVAGLGLAVWRLAKGEPGRAAAQLSSGIAGATGLGIAGSLAIDVGILIADIVYELESLGYIGN